VLSKIAETFTSFSYFTTTRGTGEVPLYRNSAGH